MVMQESSGTEPQKLVPLDSGCNIDLSRLLRHLAASFSVRGGLDGLGGLGMFASKDGG